MGVFSFLHRASGYAAISLSDNLTMTMEVLKRKEKGRVGFKFGCAGNQGRDPCSG